MKFAKKVNPLYQWRMETSCLLHENKCHGARFLFFAFCIFLVVLLLFRRNPFDSPHFFIVNRLGVPLSFPVWFYHEGELSFQKPAVAENLAHLVSELLLFSCIA